MELINNSMDATTKNKEIKMDKEIKEEFKAINDNINGIKTEITEFTAYQKGLNLADRLYEVENKVETKVSWKNLRNLVLSMIALVGAVLAIAKGIN